MPLSSTTTAWGDIQASRGGGAQIATETGYIVTRHGEFEHPHH
jgi:hypothetical protein